jgi:hypothetical protein
VQALLFATAAVAVPTVRDQELYLRLGQFSACERMLPVVRAVRIASGDNRLNAWRTGARGTPASWHLAHLSV